MAAQVLRPPQKDPQAIAAKADLVRPVQLLVEGPDDLHLVCALLGISQQHCSNNRLQIHVVGGKNNFKLPMNAWKAGSQQAAALAGTVEKVVILVDNDSAGSYAAAAKAFRDAGFPCPAGHAGQAWESTYAFKTEVILVPAPPLLGAIEDLLLAALTDDPTLAQSDAFLHSAGSVAPASRTPPLGANSAKHFVDSSAGSKARVQAYLSQFAQDGYKLIGMAFADGIIDPNAPAFDALRKQLASL